MSDHQIALELIEALHKEGRIFDAERDALLLGLAISEIMKEGERVLEALFRSLDAELGMGLRNTLITEDPTAEEIGEIAESAARGIRERIERDAIQAAEDRSEIVRCPVPLGTPVYSSMPYTKPDGNPGITIWEHQMRLVDIPLFGKCVFGSREEAESALKGR